MHNASSQFYPVTVNQAISKGRRMITYPCIFMIIVLPLIVILCMSEVYSVMLSPLIFLLGIAIAAIYRAYQVPKWRVWAFSGVRNVYELQRRAEFAMLIPGELNPGLKRFEIWSPAQRQQWVELESRFQQADEFVDQPEIPAETRVYYSIWIRLMYVLLSVISIGFGLLLILMPGDNPTSWSALWGYLFGTAIIGGMGYFGFHAIKQMLERNPQIIITDLGLQTSFDHFHSWGEIMDVRISSRGTGRYQSNHLLYGINGVTRDLQLDGLTMGRKKLDQRIRIHRGRFMQGQGQHGKGSIHSPINYI